MPDISMCKNEQCALKNNCFRYRAKPNEFRQAYSVFAPSEDGTCKDFSSIVGWADYKLTAMEGK